MATTEVLSKLRHRIDAVLRMAADHHLQLGLGLEPRHHLGQDTAHPPGRRGAASTDKPPEPEAEEPAQEAASDLQSMTGDVVPIRILRGDAEITMDVTMGLLTP
mgnify:CR=1 FL=1